VDSPLIGKRVKIEGHEEGVVLAVGYEGGKTWSVLLVLDDSRVVARDPANARMVEG
jgi:hypothetical protein